MKQLLIILWLCAWMATASVAQDSARQVLREDAFFDIVLKYHPVARQAGILVEKAKADVLIAKDGFDPRLATNLSQKTFDGTDYYHHVQPELRIPTWFGIELVAGAEYLEGQRTNREETLGETSYAGIVVPLAKNLLMDKRRAALGTARIFRNLSELEKNEILNNLLVDAAYTYWEWALRFQQYRVLQEAVLVNEKRLALVQTAYRQGDRAALDTVEAMAQLQQFRLQRNDAHLAWQNAGLELSVFLWQKNDAPYLLPPTVTPDSSWVATDVATVVLPVLDELMAWLRTSHPQLQQYPLKLDALRLDQKLKFQELLPRIDFKYNQLGKGYNMVQAKSGPLFNNNYQFGLSFSVPLRLSGGRGAYRKARLKVAETRLEQGLKIRQAENKLEMAYNELSMTVTQADIAAAAYKNYFSLQRGEELKFYNGESSLFLLNSRETKTLEAMQKLLKVKADYFKKRNTLLWAAGLLWQQ